MVVSTALEYLVKEVRNATSSMTSVPKPLKYLRPHYDTLKHCHAMAKESVPSKKLMADLLAVLAMTMSEPGSHEILHFKKQGTINDLGSWGHEFVRALAGELGAEYTASQLSDKKGSKDNFTADLISLVDELVPCLPALVIRTLVSQYTWLRFHLQHNAYAEAVDLLIETQSISKLLGNYPLRPGKTLVDDSNFKRVCLYLLRCGTYIADPDDLKCLRQSAFQIYRRHGYCSAALGVALKMGDDDEATPFNTRCKELFDTTDGLMRKQMAFLLARHHSNFEYVEDLEVDAIIGNNKLKSYYAQIPCLPGFTFDVNSTLG